MAKATHFVVYFIARVSGPGFLDMLRYDSACPASSAEAARMEVAITDMIPKWVVFRRFVPKGAPSVPSVDRWRSFGSTCDGLVYEEAGNAERRREVLERAQGDGS